MNRIINKDSIRIFLQLLILIVFTFWTIALATNNTLLLEAKIKEFCGDNIQYKVNGFGEVAMQKNFPSITSKNLNISGV